MFSSMFLCSCCHKRCRERCPSFGNAPSPTSRYPTSSIIIPHPQRVFCERKSRRMNRNCLDIVIFVAFDGSTLCRACRWKFQFLDEDGKFLVPTLSCQKSIHSFMLTFFLQEPKPKVFHFCSSQYATIGRGSTSTCDSLMRTLYVFFLGL